jgi:hypothetical protein
MSTSDPVFSSALIAASGSPGNIGLEREPTGCRELIQSDMGIEAFLQEFGPKTLILLYIKIFHNIPYANSL